MNNLFKLPKIRTNYENVLIITHSIYVIFNFLIFTSLAKDLDEYSSYALICVVSSLVGIIAFFANNKVVDLLAMTCLLIGALLEIYLLGIALLVYFFFSRSNLFLIVVAYVLLEASCTIALVVDLYQRRSQEALEKKLENVNFESGLIVIVS